MSHIKITLDARKKCKKNNSMFFFLGTYKKINKNDQLSVIVDRYMHPIIASECEHTYTCPLSLSLRLFLSLFLIVSLFIETYAGATFRLIAATKKIWKKKENAAHIHTQSRADIHTHTQTGTQMSSPSLHRYRCCYRRL